MKKAVTLLILAGFFLVIIQNTSLNAQSAKSPINAGKELKEGLIKLTADKNLKSGLHTIFKSTNGTMYCVKLKNGEVNKLIVTSSEGVQVKPKFISQGKNKPCIVCATLSKKPLVEECWEWICPKAK
ncbi:hypothetical protein C0389_03895 [bacterium]|nr:hypothetical protein [bacterium]